MNLKSVVLFSTLLLLGMTIPVFAQSDSESVFVTVSSDKTSYLFDEVAVIQGSVSEEVFIMKPTFIPEKILINISGNSFEKAITLYPDSNLRFKITQNLQQVLGITGGEYVVSVIYGDAVSQTIFSVGSKIIQNEIENKQSLSIDTDKLQYLPGSYVEIIAQSDFVSPLEGMHYEVHNPNDQIIFSGTLFPVNDVFSTHIFLNTVHPRYGTYQIIGNYSDQTAVTTFELVEDMKEEKLISIWTDKEVYGLGETVSVSGRLNNFWIPSLNIEITQMRNLSFGDSDGFAKKTKDVVHLDGIGSFSYSFKIPAESGLGDYVIKVSENIGSAEKSFIVSENIDEHISKNEFTILLNSDSLYFGDELILTGKIPHFGTSSISNSSPVILKIFDSSGKSLEMIGYDRGEEDPENRSISVEQIFSSMPDDSGRFIFEIPIQRTQFDIGSYDVFLKYGTLSTTEPFSINDPIDVSQTTLNLDKKIYGLNEIVTLTGITPMASSTILITLTDPDGEISIFDTLVDNQQFTWNWETPKSEYTSIIKSDGARSVTSTNIGIYKISIQSGKSTHDLFFKVSLTPDSDSLSDSSLFVVPEKYLNKAGDKLFVSGTVLMPSINDIGFAGHERIHLQILDAAFPYTLISESAVYPKPDGLFHSYFELPVTVFSSGEYKIRANYYGYVSESLFTVSNDFVFGVDDDLFLDISSDKSQYFPGDVVNIVGKPNKMIFLDTFDISIIKESNIQSACGLLLCGLPQGLTVSLLPSPSASFDYSFVIDNSASSLGTYEVMVDADFETKSLQFTVVSPSKLDTVIEKQNRISEKTISVLTEEKIIHDTSVAPRVLSGSLITPSRDDQSNVNIQVTNSGICIIGTNIDCLVNDSTRAQGKIYDVVEIDGMNFNVRYSGPDARLEKFSILPESSEEFLPDTNWNVFVIKDEQVSRFYYKVTYKTLE